LRRFIITRVLYSILTLWILTVIIFSMVRLTGDPAELLSEYPGAPEADLEAQRERWGLNESWPTQYRKFVFNVFRGDFGRSFQFGTSVTDIYFQRLPNSLQLAAAGFFISMVIGIPLGILSAVKRGTMMDTFGKVVALIGQSAPPFWLGIMLMFLFAVKLGMVPPYGKQDWNSIILPAVTLGWYYAAANLRLVRSAMLDVLDSEYIKLARAKGVDSRTIIMKHAFRNALIPPLTFAGVTIGALVTGSLVVETVFAWPGLGRLAIEALFAFDYPLLQGVVITFTLLYVTAAFIVDVLYAYIDPRIRYA